LQEKVEEGFRILTLEKDVDKDVLEFIRNYQILASHLYWSRRLDIKPSDTTIEKLRRDVKSYWRWHVVDEKDPMYLFKNVERTPRPSSMLIRIPLVDALHPRKGAFVQGSKLVLRVNKKVEIEMPKRAVEWLNKRLSENPDKKTVRVFERDNKLVAQIVLSKKNVVKLPENPLLVIVDFNSSYSMVVHYWDNRLIRTEKYRPPNRNIKWKSVKRLMKVRDNLYNQGTITQRQINLYSALIRKTLEGSMKSWIQQTVDKIVRRTKRLSKRHKKEPLVLMDMPDDDSLRGSSLQRSIMSFSRYLENILSWYGVYWEETRLYSTICPKCGGKLNLEQKTKRMRIMKCQKCGFREDRDNIPLYWAINRLPAPRRGEAS
jgi:Putative transposase DNA-binding domain.